MTIQPIGFIDTAAFTAHYWVKYRERAMDLGDMLCLELRSTRDGADEPADRPILKEWRSARALLSKIRSGAAPFFNGIVPDLGNVTVETLQPGAHLPWGIDSGDYAEEHIRLRLCLIPSPGAMTYSGPAQGTLAVGMINAIDHRVLHSEVNFGDTPRVHLVVDVRRPDA